MNMDIKSLVEWHPLVEEILEEENQEDVGIWKVAIKKCPVELRIKVLRRHNSELPYTGIADHSIKPLENISPYRSMYKYFKTPTKALDESLRGFLCYYKLDLVDKIKFKKEEDW